MSGQTERRRRDLSLDRVVSTAVELARDVDERSITMRRVADACGVTPMALYHHVENKEMLLTLIVDRVVGEALASRAASPREWRVELVEFVCRFREAFLDHRTAAEVFLRRPVLSRNLALCTEFMFLQFERAGLRGAAIPEATDAVVLLAMGSIANDLTRPAAVRDALVTQAADEELPLLIRHLDDYSRRNGEQRFRLALGWLIDSAVTA